MKKDVQLYDMVREFLIRLNIATAEFWNKNSKKEDKKEHSHASYDNTNSLL
jgi:hypothetical protein